MSRCLICDGPTAVRQDREGALAFVALTAAILGVDILSASLCTDHRESWALTLLRGGVVFDDVAAKYPNNEAAT